MSKAKYPPLFLDLLKQNGPKSAVDLARMTGATDAHSVLRRMEAAGQVKLLSDAGELNLFGLPHQTLADIKEDVPRGYKRCIACGIVLPQTSDHFHKHSRGGWRARCKPCQKAKDSDYYARSRNSQQNDRSEALLPAGRVTEEHTQGGRRIRFGKDWRPHREGRRYNVPGLMGYASPLTSLYA